jgi:sterol desaturase/sphingolipid hydroxylase (fatty acid hydroxylase superfamily)
MKKKYVSNSQDSVRMFKSELFELLSKVHFTVPLFIFIPVIAFSTWKAFAREEVSAGGYLLYFFIGLFIWTITEYLLHRFIFHFELPGKIGRRIHFIFHGVHHDYPSDRLRLVMPPAVSIPLAALFFWLFSLVLSNGQLYSFFPGFITGYLFYDISHYAIHHFNFKGSVWKKIKQHHMLHHYSDPHKGYGVSSSIWDKIFHTDFPKKSR